MAESNDVSMSLVIKLFYGSKVVFDMKALSGSKILSGLKVSFVHKVLSCLKASSACASATYISFVMETIGKGFDSDIDGGRQDHFLGCTKRTLPYMIQILLLLNFIKLEFKKLLSR